jgi:RNA polymerase sporulation-specific sigma factor
MTSYTLDDTRPVGDAVPNWKDANAELHITWVNAQAALAEAVAHGDDEAIATASRALEQVGTDFFNQNRGLAMSVARLFFLPGDERGQDYVQAASLGLWEAFLKWDPAKGATFGTFSRQYIKGRTQRAVRVDEYGHLTQNDFARRRDVLNAKADLTKKLDREPSIEEIIKETGLSLELVNRILTGRNASLDQVIGDDGATLGDLIAQRPEDDILDDVVDIESLLDELNELELWVMLQRYDALGGDPTRSLLEIGDDIGVGREITRRAETRARLRIAQMNLARKNGRRPTIAELSEATQVDAKKIPLLLRGSADDLAARWERLRKEKHIPQGALNRLGEEFIVSNAEMIWNLANGYVYEPGSDEPLSVEDAALATWDAFCTWDDNGETTFPAWARRLVDRTYPRRRRSRDEQPDPDLLEPSAYDHICSYLWELIRDRRLTPAPRNLSLQR